MRINSSPRAAKNVIPKFVLPVGEPISSFNQFFRPVMIMASAFMKRRILLPFATCAIAASLLFLPACRKHQRVGKTAPPPLPSRTAPAPATSRETPQAPRTSSEPRRKVPAEPVGYTEQGIASWYGIPYHGRRAADGEIYDMETLVAAHRLLPFNTWLKVTNLANNKSVNVRIIDRGPFVEGRILDLSKAAARQIDLLGPGIGQVRLEVIGAPVDNPSNEV
jgi:rare lipoprotein A